MLLFYLAPLLLWGGLTATVMIFLMLKWKPDSPPPVWPVTVAIVIFLSLWWLAALLFDLIFVWHRYIRHEAGHERLKAIYATACAAKITPRPTSGGTDTTKHGN